MSDFLIRRALPEDAPALKDCITRAFAQFEALELPPVAEGLEEAIQSTPVFVAERGGEVLGAMILRRAPRQLTMEIVAVTPEAQHTGLGRALIATAETEARLTDAHRIDLATHARLSEAIAVYEHLGWQEVEREGDKIRMSKAI